MTLTLQILVCGFPITCGPGVNRAAKSNCLERGREGNPTGDQALETREALGHHSNTPLAACTGFASGTEAPGTSGIFTASGLQQPG